MCILDGCNHKKKYGEYCYKHRRNFFIDNTKHPSKAIRIDRWTNKCSDYLRKDIIDNLCDPWYVYTDGTTTEDGITLENKGKQELFLLLTKNKNVKLGLNFSITKLLIFLIISIFNFIP